VERFELHKSGNCKYFDSDLARGRVFFRDTPERMPKPKKLCVNL
jgi:hypothetical protein